MNILYLSADRGIPIRGHKGAAIHVRALTDAFVRAGHRVTLLSPRLGPATGPAPLAELVEVPLPAVESEGDPAARDRQSQAYGDVLFAAARAQLEARRCDFIYERHSLWSDAGARLSRAAGLPLVLEVNAPLRFESAAYRSLSGTDRAAQIEHTQFQGAHAISVVSEELRDYVLEQGVRPERVHVLLNAVDPHQFHPAVRGGDVRARFDLHGRLVVGFVGRPRPWHDIGTLLKAFARLRGEDARYHLLMVGEVPDELAAQFAALGIEQAVTATGPVPHASVPEHIAAMDVAVCPHPRLDRFYFSPLKLFEYMACGVPTVAAEIGQPARLIYPGETGYVYPPGDAAALADRIRVLLAQPDHARDVAWAGAVHVLANHTWDGNARAVATWIEPERPEPEPDPAVWPRPVSLPILDSKLRQRLYRATRVDLAAPLLARRLSGGLKKSAKRMAAEGSIKVLKYKPGRRCVLLYGLPQGRGQLPVIGKVYRDERGQRLFDLQDYLWRAGFGPAALDSIHVPRPLAYVPEMRMLVQECAPGETLNDLVAAMAPGPLVRRSAEGLAKLHATALPPAAGAGGLMGTYGLADELAGLDRFAGELAEARPGDAAAIFDLAGALQHWGEGLPPPEAAALVHRDFYYSQVLFHGPRLTLIDFDLLALGDPAIDVANFAAHLAFLALDRLGDLAALDDESQTFVEAYARRRPLGLAFRQRLAFYEAATFFRLMNVVATRPGLMQHFDLVYRRSLACLDSSCRQAAEVRAGLAGQ